DRRSYRLARYRWMAAGGRDAVRRDQLSGDGASCGSRGEDADARPRQRRPVDHAADSGIRRHQGEGAPRREPRDVLRPHGRAQGGSTVVGPGWLPVVAAGDREPRPGDRAGTEGSVLVEGIGGARERRPWYGRRPG